MTTFDVRYANHVVRCEGHAVPRKGEKMRLTSSKGDVVNVVVNHVEYVVELVAGAAHATVPPPQVEVINAGRPLVPRTHPWTPESPPSPGSRL